MKSGTFRVPWGYLVISLFVASLAVFILALATEISPPTQGFDEGQVTGPATDSALSQAAGPAAGLSFLPLFLLIISSGLMVAFSFARLQRNRLLENAVRKRIYEFIADHPGKHYRAILSHLGLSMGVLTYHLNTLERGELITSNQDGVYRRFYQAGRKAELRRFLSKIQQKIVAVIEQNGGISQAGIAQTLELSRPLVNYHLHVLQDAGLVRLVPRGRETGCFLVVVQPVS